MKETQEAYFNNNEKNLFDLLLHEKKVYTLTSLTFERIIIFLNIL